MQPKKTQMWLTLFWNDMQLQSLRLDVPRPIWLGENGDLVVPEDAIAAPRVLLLTHAGQQWLHPDGRALALGEAATRHFGDFVVQFQLSEREPTHLPLAWPRELAQLALSLAFAIALVAMPLWLGSRQTRRHLVLVTDQELTAIVPVPAFVDAQTQPEPPPAADKSEPTEHIVWFEPTTIDLPRPEQPPAEIVAAQPSPPQPSQGRTPEAPAKPRQSTTRVATENPQDLLNALDQQGTPHPTRTKLWSDPQPGNVEATNGTDVPHVESLATSPHRQAPSDTLAQPQPGPRKIATDGEPELKAGRQDIVLVTTPRPRVEGNGLDADTVHAFIQRMHGQLRHCLELGMLGGEKLNGRVRVAFVIAPDGSVMQARVAESALHQPATEDCIADGIRGWKFPAASSGLPTRVQHGFVFRTK